MNRLTDQQDVLSQFKDEHDAQELVRNARLCHRLRGALVPAQRLENAAWRKWYKQHDTDKRASLPRAAVPVATVPPSAPAQQHTLWPTQPMFLPHYNPSTSSIPLPLYQNTPVAQGMATDSPYAHHDTSTRLWDGIPSFEDSHAVQAAYSQHTAPEQHVSPGMLQLFPPPSDQFYAMEGCTYVDTEPKALQKALGFSPRRTSFSSQPHPSALPHRDQPSSSSQYEMVMSEQRNSPLTPTCARVQPRRDLGSGASTPTSHSMPICSNCGTDTTPLWRRNHDTMLLCNACGLYLKIHKTHRPLLLRQRQQLSNMAKPSGQDRGVRNEPTSCSNCGTHVTPLWRKDENGAMLCNACGLYLKLHGEHRPPRYRADVIRKRTRYDPRQPEGLGDMQSSPLLDSHAPLDSNNRPEYVPSPGMDTIMGTAGIPTAPCDPVDEAKRLLSGTHEPVANYARLACCGHDDCTGPVLMDDKLLQADMPGSPFTLDGIDLSMDALMQSTPLPGAKSTLWPVFLAQYSGLPSGDQDTAASSSGMSLPSQLSP